MKFRILDISKPKITKTSYQIFKWAVYISFTIAQLIAFYDVIFVRMKNYSFSFNEPLKNLLIFCELFQYPILIFVPYIGVFLLLIASKPKQEQIKESYKNETTDFDKYLYPRRTEIFTEFLTKLEKCKKDINGIIFTTQIGKHNKPNYDLNKLPYIIKDIFEPLLEMKFSVKVILSEKYRELFDKIHRIC